MKNSVSPSELAINLILSGLFFFIFILSLTGCAGSLDTGGTSAEFQLTNDPDATPEGQPIPRLNTLYQPYDMGSPVFTDIWVNPSTGNDSNSGTTADTAVRSLAEAWRRIPSGTTLTHGYRVMLDAGTYPSTLVPPYFENRQGTYSAPVVFQAARGRNTAFFTTNLNIYNVQYLYIVDINITDPGEPIHCEACDHFLVRGTTLRGGTGTSRSAKETFKVNQTQYIFVEFNDIANAWDNNMDFVAVQYGHVIGNTFHNSGDWCAYAKGGSAYLRYEGNEFYGCDNGGFTAGQGSGFEWTVSPWIHYEAYNIKFINNVIHDSIGGAFGVNGGYNIFMAYNTAYRVGSHDHVLEFLHGGHSCDGNWAACSARLAAGGWGPPSVSESEPIPNKNVYVFNNLIYNPPGFQSLWSHFTIERERTPLSGSNVPAPNAGDQNLRIRGNIIFNGPPSMSLGIGSPYQNNNDGCQDSNPTCNEAQLLADNAINTFQPQLMNPSGGDYSLAAGSNVLTWAGVSFPSFTGGDAPTTPSAPVGDLTNLVPYNFLGVARTGADHVGAF